MIVSVYGSLRKGLGNHKLLKKGKAKYLGVFQTEPEYSMYSIGTSFPGIIEKGTTSIIMEAYEIDEDTLKSLDSLEGYSKSDHDLYKRIIIDTPFGKSHTYIYNHDTQGLVKVTNGDWVAFKKLQSIYNYA